MEDKKIKFILLTMAFIMALSFKTTVYANHDDGYLTSSEKALFDSEVNRIVSGMNAKWSDDERASEYA